MHEKTKGYGVNVHEPKSQSIQRNAKKWNTSFIVVLHLEVIMRPSTIILTHTLHITIHTRSICACPKPGTCRRWLYLLMNCLVFFLSLLLQIRSLVIFIELINTFFILWGSLELTLRCELIFTVKGVHYPPVNLFCNTLGRCMGCCVIDLF